jgi:hypothetical protein
MKDERYMSWFRQVVEMGWTCGVYHPPEILANYFHGYLDAIRPHDEPIPYEFIERFMIDTTEHDFMLSKPPSLEHAIKHFDNYYDRTSWPNRIDFREYTRLRDIILPENAHGDTTV